MDPELKGKNALVTGASEGIGMASARQLAEGGVRVPICARTEARLLDAAAERLGNNGAALVVDGSRSLVI